MNNHYIIHKETTKFVFLDEAEKIEDSSRNNEVQTLEQLMQISQTML